MRKRNQKQMPLTPTSIEHPHATELKLISRILDTIPTRAHPACGQLWNWSRGNERGAGSAVCDCKANGAL